MDFSLTDEQLKASAATLRFAQEQLSEDTAARDHDGSFPLVLWKKCADFGIQSLPVSREYSGRPERDILTAMLMMEALGCGCADNGLAFALNAQMWTVQLPIVQFGSSEQKSRYLPGLCDGSLIGAHAITEAEAGSDLFSMKTRADKCDGGYRLSGTKCYVTLGPVADVALVFATINPELGKWGVTAFLVETNRAGFQAGPTSQKMGLRTAPFGDLVMEDCFIPVENRLGPEGAGISISNHSLEYERCCILASQLGAMQRQLDQAVQYAKSRRQFGQPIGKFQAVAHRIAEMKLQLETSRLLLYKTAWLKREGKSAMLEAALCKLHLSECFVQSGLDAVRIHGGKGYTTEMGVERDLRDAVGGVLYAGTSDIQRNIIAQLLGL